MSDLIPSMTDPATQSADDVRYRKEMSVYFPRSLGSDWDKLSSFPKFVSRQALSVFLAKQALFDRVIGMHGVIVECGVFLGAGLMTWAQLSAIFEPYNHNRRIIGFDTFTGFEGLHSKDKLGALEYSVEGGLAVDAQADLLEAIRLYDLNRPIGHIERVQVVVGDGVTTIPDYVAANRHLVVAMLYLDFDLYEPTRVALETFLPRMPKGSILAFDELNQAAWPGETLAVLETVGLRNLRIERFPFTPQLSFAVL